MGDLLVVAAGRELPFVGCLFQLALVVEDHSKQEGGRMMALLGGVMEIAASGGDLAFVVQIHSAFVGNIGRALRSSGHAPVAGGVANYVLPEPRDDLVRSRSLDVEVVLVSKGRGHLNPTNPYGDDPANAETTLQVDLLVDGQAQLLSAPGRVD